MGSKKTTTTQKPIIDPALQSGMNDIWSRTATAMTRAPESYVAPLDKLQRQAGRGASNLGGNQSLFGEAGDITRSLIGGGAARASSGTVDPLGIQRFMNPYMDQVIGGVTKPLAQQRDMALDQNALDYAGAGGGSNELVKNALTQGQFDLNSIQGIGGLLNEGWANSGQLANAQADRDNAISMANLQAELQNKGLNLQGAGQLANIGSASGASERADIGLQSDIGGTFQDTAQRVAQSPLDLINFGSGVLGGPMSQSTIGQNSVQKTKDPMGMISGLLQGLGTAAQGAAMFSDVRLKRDIERVGTRPDGLGVYLFRYLWSPVRYIGVMAQEVLKVKPEAVSAHPSGFLMVDYGRL